MGTAIARAERFNRDCECAASGVPALSETHPQFFADIPVFLAREREREMSRLIGAVESVTRLPAYRQEVLAYAPPIARDDPGTRGVFLGFDFHIAADGPKLIEINTNAGGALLNIEMQRLQQSCCPEVAHAAVHTQTADTHEQAIVDMFMQEWRAVRGNQPLRTIAIVDDAPREQFLYPEFLLFQKLFEAHGIRALIVDAAGLRVDGGSLRHEGMAIDLVYNRCTDFYFTEPNHAALAEAYTRGLAVVTPHPHAHALYSNKANLVILSDAATLRRMGAASEDIDTLIRGIPQTLRVTAPGQSWWEDRKRWFFKPVSGFGSRGTYRGDKITRRAFDDVMQGDYVAQRIAPPSERRRGAALGSGTFKMDVRSYVYGGEQQLLAARLYCGQTTNFRTAGGGFAPIHVLEDAGGQGPRTLPAGCTRDR